jgi:hypothetical protein
MGKNPKHRDISESQNKLRSMPVLMVHHIADNHYNWSSYNLTPEKYSSLVKYLEEIRKNPEKALNTDNPYHIKKLPLNIKLELFGLSKYGIASIYNGELDLSFVSEVQSFEDAYKEVIKNIESTIKSWDDSFHARWVEKDKLQKAKEKLGLD